MFLVDLRAAATGLFGVGHRWLHTRRLRFLTTAPSKTQKYPRINTDRYYVRFYESFTQWSLELIAHIQNISRQQAFSVRSSFLDLPKGEKRRKKPNEIIFIR
jgi:hypothetical protein